MSYQDHLSENPAIVAPASVAAKMMAFRTELARVVAMVKEVATDGAVIGTNETARCDLDKMRDEAKRLAEVASALEGAVKSIVG